MRVIFESPPVTGTFTDPRTGQTLAGVASLRVLQYEPDEEVPTRPTQEPGVADRLSELRAQAGLFGGTGVQAVGARRLDGPAPSPRIEKDNNPGGGPSDRAATIHFPTSGCWEVTYMYAGTQLQFVVLVQRN